MSYFINNQILCLDINEYGVKFSGDTVNELLADFVAKYPDAAMLLFRPNTKKLSQLCTILVGEGPDKFIVSPDNYDTPLEELPGFQSSITLTSVSVNGMVNFEKSSAYKFTYG